eukprot:COSAG02_NODE_4201_length_5632_cov_5.111874_1_plen_310_part_00
MDPNEGTVFGRPEAGIGHPASSPLARDKMYIRMGRKPVRFTVLHGMVTDVGRESELVAELHRIRTGQGHRALQQLLDQEDEGGCTPLMRAAYQGSTDNVRALLAVGADASAVSSRTRRTALHEAASSVHDNPEVSGLLLGAGCDPNQKATVNGRTALEITKLKIGPDGHLGSSLITAQLAPLARSNGVNGMDRSGFRNFEGEVVALRHIASTLDLPRALKRHAELMTGVREFGLDLLGMIEQEGVENAYAHNATGAPRYSLILALASRCAAALLSPVRTDAVRVRFICLYANDVVQGGRGVHEGRRVAS